MKIGLLYYKGILTDEDVRSFEDVFNGEGIEFKALDKTGQIIASIDDLDSVFTVVLNCIGTSGVLYSLSASAAWDSLKMMMGYIVNKTKEKKVYRVTSKSTEEKNITISLQTSVNNNDFHFKFEGLKETEELNQALDKILSFINEQYQKPKQDNKKTYITTFDRQLEEWVTRDFLEELRRKYND